MKHGSQVRSDQVFSFSPWLAYQACWIVVVSKYMTRYRQYWLSLVLIRWIRSWHHLFIIPRGNSEGLLDTNSSERPPFLSSEEREREATSVVKAPAPQGIFFVDETCVDNNCNSFLGFN